MLVAAALVSAVPATGGVIVPTPVQIDTLTAIDTPPTPAVVDLLFASGPGPTPGQDALLALARDTSQDLGLQIRALRALPQYCLPAGCAGSAVHAALATIVDDYRTQLAAGPLGPRDVLRLRVAMEALGATRSGQQSDVDLLTDPVLLRHPSRDVQVTAVAALRSLCSPNLCTPDACQQDASAVRALRSGSGTETQVDAAINSALADLARCVQP